MRPSYQSAYILGVWASQLCSSGKAGSILKGAAYGCADFVADSAYGLGSCMTCLGCQYPDCDSCARYAYMDSMDQICTRNQQRFDAWMQRTFSVDPSDYAYQRARSYTATGLTVASAATGTVGLVRAAVWATGLARAPMMTSALCQTSGKALSSLEACSVQKLNSFHLNAKALPEVAQSNIRILRGWAKSKGWKQLPNAQGAPEKWGRHVGGKFHWNLKIKAGGSTHHNLDAKSYLPRFDSRIRVAPEVYHYINPFTGEMGARELGSHLSLFKEYF